MRERAFPQGKSVDVHHNRGGSQRHEGLPESLEIAAVQTTLVDAGGGAADHRHLRRPRNDLSQELHTFYSPQSFGVVEAGQRDVVLGRPARVVESDGGGY